MTIFRTLLLVVLCSTMVVPPPAAAEPQNAATAYLPGEEEIPVGFQHDPEQDNFISMPNVERAFRVYFRGDQASPLQARTTLMVSASISDSVESAVSEFAIAQRGYSVSNSYEFTPLDPSLGDQAVVGRATFYADTAHPKAGTLILFRRGAINGAVQWTDDLDQPTFDQVLAVAQIIESHASEA